LALPLSVLDVPEHFESIKKLVVLLMGDGLLTGRWFLGKEITVQESIVCLIHQLDEVLWEEYKWISFETEWTFLPKLREYFVCYLDWNRDLGKALNEMFR
jgi:hypothetical protein